MTAKYSHMPTMAYFTKEKQPICYVLRNDQITVALTKMTGGKFSQLPVLKNKKSAEEPIRRNDIAGVISLENIGRFVLDRNFTRTTLVGKCLDDNDPLTSCKESESIKDVAERMEGEYVLVFDAKQSLLRLVTHYDLSKLYLNLAKPFSLIESIELSLRKRLRKLSIDFLKEAANVEKRKGLIRGVEDLEFSEYITLFSNYWDKLGKRRIPKTTFLEGLENIRVIRNKIMHFRPEGITDSDRNQLEGFRDLLKKL